MSPTNRWPVRLRHDKCNSDMNSFALELAVERTGVIVITCACIDCDEEFELVFGILELVAEALLADKTGRIVPDTAKKALPFPTKKPH